MLNLSSYLEDLLARPENRNAREIVRLLAVERGWCNNKEECRRCPVRCSTSRFYAS